MSIGQTLEVPQLLLPMNIFVYLTKPIASGIFKLYFFLSHLSIDTTDQTNTNKNDDFCSALAYPDITHKNAYHKQAVLIMSRFVSSVRGSSVYQGLIEIRSSAAATHFLDFLNS